MFIDTHAHLYWDSFKDDFLEVLKKAYAAGVTEIINIGTDVKTSQEATRINSDNVKFYSSIGIHPHEAVKYYTNTDVSIHKDIEQLGRVYQDNISKVVAVGECGLDFVFHPDYMKTPIHTPLTTDQLKKLQIKLFDAQIKLAKRLNLPLTVHCRDDRSNHPSNTEAWDLVLRMVGNHPAILHCYSGLPLTTRRILTTANLLVSFSATLTYPKNGYLKDAVKILPLEKLALETDCPFLPPQSKRGLRCEPADLLETAQLIAGLKSVSIESLASQTTLNVKRLLKLV